MIPFFFKKAFFDGWDHLLGLLVLNLGFLAAIGIALLSGLGASFPPLALGLLCLALLAGSWWYAVSSLVTLRWSDYKSFAIADLPPLLREALVPGLQIGLFLVADLAALTVGIPFYLERGIPGALAAGVIFWASLVLVLALQYYLPLRFRLGGGLRKNLRKSLIVLADNVGFSLLLFLWSGVSLVLSVFLAFLVPGLAGLALGQNDALRLRMLKYDWLEAQAAGKAELVQSEPARATGRTSIPVPWKELLAEEVELLGKRTLRGMIFPWKD
jgi:hypothetical protein